MAYIDEVLADSPSAIWRNEQTSGNLIDQINALAAVPANAGDMTYQVTGAAGTSKAVSFSGATGGATASDDNALDLGDTLTIEFWIKRGTTGTVQTLIEKGTGTNSGYAVWFNTSNVLQFSDGAGNAFVSSTALSDTASWHHVVMTKSGSTRYVYIDGVEVGSPGTDRTLADNANALTIGSTGSLGNRFIGSLDEVAFYKSALASGRVSAHYTAGITDPVSPFDIVMRDNGTGPFDIALSGGGAPPAAEDIFPFLGGGYYGWGAA